MTTRRMILAGAAALAAAPLTVRAQPRPPPFWPDAGEWQRAEAAAAGFDPDRLASAVKTALADHSSSVMILRDGRIVAEVYGDGVAPDKAMDIGAGAHGMLAMLVGMAIDDGKILGVNQSASDFIPDWKATPREGVTVRHLLTMTSGLDDLGLAVRDIAGDQFALNTAAALAHPPGSQWHYNIPAAQLLFHLIARATGEPFEAYAARKLTGPLGMTSTTWLTSDGKNATGAPVKNYYSASATAGDLARLGLFAAAGGVWDGKSLVSRAYAYDAVHPSQTFNASYGYLWWVNEQPGLSISGVGETNYRFDGAPAETFAALGAAGQDVLVIASAGIVAVRQGTAPSDAARPESLAANLTAALTGPPPSVRRN